MVYSSALHFFAINSIFRKKAKLHNANIFLAFKINGTRLVPQVPLQSATVVCHKELNVIQAVHAFGVYNRAVLICYPKLPT